MNIHTSMLRLSGYLAGTAAAATLVSCGAAKAPESRPNVIYIMADASAMPTSHHTGSSSSRRPT